VAGTLVATKEGLRPIEDVQAGDFVWSRSYESGAEEWKRVVGTFETQNKAVVTLITEGPASERETLKVTSEHPLMTSGGWVEAGQLEPGQIVIARDRWVRVVEVITTGETATVYNFEVADFHTYFVGDSGVWAHNTNCGGAGASGGVPDGHLVCRGGSCTAERFTNGSGVTTDAAGKLQGASVNAAESLEAAARGIPHRKVGVTTAGDIRAAGGNVTPSPTRANPNHATMSGISADTAERLFTPTVRNPHAR